MTKDEFKELFEKEMLKQGRSITRDSRGYTDYGVIISWWAAQWTFDLIQKETRA